MSIVTTERQLKEIISRIDALGRFGMDLEFIPERTYSPELCLVQISTGGEEFIIDPIALPELDLLWMRVADPDIMVILHAAAHDLDLVHLSSGLIPQNIMDTQIAAGFLGFGYPVGYGKLLNQLLGVSISKTESFTDWMSRPLTDSQIHYALDDVKHLLPICDQLTRQLEEDNRLSWVVEECRRYCHADFYAVDHTLDYLKIKGASSLTRRGLAVLKELCWLRDLEARSANKPVRAIIGDNILFELARRPPSQVDEIQRIRGIRPDQIRQYGEKLIKAIAAGRSLSDDDCPSWPSFKTPPRREVLIADILFAVLKTICYDLGLAPELVSSRADLQTLVRAHRDARIEQNQVPLLQGWRRQIAGQALVDLLDGASLEMQIVSGEPPLRLLIDPGTKSQSRI